MKRFLSIVYISTLVYAMLLVLFFAATIIIERTYPRSYFDGQIYSMNGLISASFYANLEELIRQNPTLIKGYKDTITNEKYLQGLPEDGRISCSLYIAEDNCIFHFTAFDTKHGFIVSLEAQGTSWNPRDGTWRSFMPPALSLRRGGMLSFKEYLSMCDSFERNILSHIGAYEKDQRQGILVWCYRFFWGNLPILLLCFLIPGLIGVIAWLATWLSNILRRAKE